MGEACDEGAVKKYHPIWGIRKESTGIKKGKRGLKLLFKVPVGGEQFVQVISTTQCRDVPHNQIPVEFQNEQAK